MREDGVSSSAYYTWGNGQKTVTVDDQKFTTKEVKVLKKENARLREEVGI